MSSDDFIKLSASETHNPSERGLSLNLGLFTASRLSPIRQQAPFLRPRGITTPRPFQTQSNTKSLLQEVAHLSVQSKQTISKNTNGGINRRVSEAEQNPVITELVESSSTVVPLQSRSSFGDLMQADSYLPEEEIVQQMTAVPSKSASPFKGMQAQDNVPDEEIVQPLTANTAPTGQTVFKEDQHNVKHSDEDSLSDFGDPAFKEHTYDRASQSSDKSRRKTLSFCSTCSLEDSQSVLSRCSFCDGCSSSGVETNPSKTAALSEHDVAKQLQANLKDVLQSGESRVLDGSPQGMLSDPCEVEEERLMDYSRLPSFPNHHRSFWQQPANDGLVSGHTQKSPLSNDQLMFLLLRVQISRYKALVDDVHEQKLVNRSQQKSIACLIQAVVILSNKVTKSSSHWLKLQTEIKQLQAEKSIHKQQLRRLKFWLFLLLLLNLLSFPTIRNRTLAILQWFGIVRRIKTINRMRKMVSENWRNIPSLLTDFWRIFIFRSQLRLDAR